MPVQVSFSLARYEDGTLTVGLAPPTAVGGWNVQFQVTKFFGGVSGLITKSVASGYSVVSGVTVVNSGKGVFSVKIGTQDTSGLDPGTYAMQFQRLDSGFRTVLSEGFFLLTP